MPTLFIRKGVNAGQQFPLDKDVLIIGRSPECDLVLPATSVSRQHARLLRIEGKWYIEDMHSRNKTHVNSEMITTRTLLKHSDRLRICDFVADFWEKPQPTLPPELMVEPSDMNGSTGHDTSSSHNSKVLANQPSENLKVMLDFSNRLVKTLDLDQLLPRITDSLFQLFKQADRCFLILEEPSGRLSTRSLRTRQPQDAAEATYSQSIVQRCLHSAEALLTDDASHDPRLISSDSLLALPIRSVMCVPLSTSEGKVFGIIQLDTPQRKRFTEDDLNLLWGVANQAAMALENARMHGDLLAREQFERDLELAGEIQRGMLPDAVPEAASYEFFAHYAAALTVGGDYYDFVPLPPQRLAITLGDVAGKGMSAALLMVRLSAEMRACLLAEADPASAVARLNDSLYPHTQRADRFVTLAVALLEPDSGQVTLVNAGHLPPLLYRRSAGTLVEAMPRDVAGTVLGRERGLHYQSHRLSLSPGDCLVLFTDGLCEAVNVQNRQPLLDGIYAVLNGGGPHTPSSLGEQLVKASQRHALKRSQLDDVTLVCFGRKP
jgi:serine phosphatase RsbU (regulator of sigma subunit)/pSer/pThr/pTyr-binding forkhead associated (FHA) protein